MMDTSSLPHVYHGGIPTSNKEAVVLLRNLTAKDITLQYGKTYGLSSKSILDCRQQLSIYSNLDDSEMSCFLDHRESSVDFYPGFDISENGDGEKECQPRPIHPLEIKDEPVHQHLESEDHQPPSFVAPGNNPVEDQDCWSAMMSLVNSLPSMNNRLKPEEVVVECSLPFIPRSSSSNIIKDNNKQALVSSLRPSKLDLNDDMETDFSLPREHEGREDLQEDMHEGLEIKQELLCQEHSEVSFDFLDVNHTGAGESCTIALANQINRVIELKQEVPLEKCTEENVTPVPVQDDSIPSTNPYKDSGERIKCYECSECSFRTTCKKAMINHAQCSHAPSSEGPSTCCLCPYTTSNADGMKQCEPRKEIKFNYAHYLKSFKTKAMLQSQILTRDPTSIEPLHCEFCAFCCDKFFVLKQHILLHHDKLRQWNFTCSFCSLKAFDEVGLMSHVLKHASYQEKSLSCPQCDFKTHLKSSLKNHIQLHLPGAKRLLCPHCPYKTNYKRDLKYHLEIHNEKIERNIACSECSFRTNRKQSLLRHIEQVHTDRKYIFVCDLCSFKIQYKESLASHIVRHDPNRNKPFACPHCPYAADNKFSLDRHLKTHLDDREKPYACSLCSFRTDQKSALKTHNIVQQPDRKSLLCPLCPFKSISEVNYRRHIYGHKINKPLFNCDVCSYSSWSKGSLKSHVLIHVPDKEKPFKCSFCPYRCAGKRQLKPHLQVHSAQEKKFVSPTCDFRTHTRHILEKHISIHDPKREKPFHCHECPYKTTLKCDLIRHAHTHNPNREKPLACPHCSYRTDNKSVYKAHIQKH